MLIQMELLLHLTLEIQDKSNRDRLCVNQSSQIQASSRSMGIFAVVSNHCLPGSKERSHQEFLSPTKPFLQKEGYWGRAPDRNYTVSRLLVLHKQEACQGWPPQPMTFPHLFVLFVSTIHFARFLSVFQNVFICSLRILDNLFWSASPLWSAFQILPSCLLTQLHVLSHWKKKQATESNSCWLTTPEHGVCSGVCLIEPGSLHWRKLLFHGQAAISFE